MSKLAPGHVVTHSATLINKPICYMMPFDLRQSEKFVALLSEELCLDTSLPTIFVAECVLNYLKPSELVFISYLWCVYYVMKSSYFRSDTLLLAIANGFQKSIVVLYEQVLIVHTTYLAFLC